jgi:hypothetical protein
MTMIRVVHPSGFSVLGSCSGSVLSSGSACHELEPLAAITNGKGRLAPALSHRREFLTY